MTIHARWLAAAALSLPLSVAADRITLNNGDTLSGQILSMRDGVLVLETDYIGEVEIGWDRIADLQTDEPIRVQTGSGDLVTARVVGIQDGELQFAEADRPRARSDVAAINPPASGFKLSGYADAGSTISRGNTESSSFSASAESVARSERNRIITGGEYYRSTEDSNETAENVRVYGRYARFITDRWFLATNLSFEHDPFRDLDLRSSAGAGVGYQFYDRDDLSLGLEAGLNAVRDDFDEGDDEGFTAARFAADYSQQVFSGAVLFHSSELLPPLDAPGEFVYTSRSGVRMPLFGGLNGTAQVNFDYDAEPPEEREKEDVIYTFKVGYSW